jgi:hypothetical protein
MTELMSLHNIEAIITKDKKEILKIKGQVHGLKECGNPKVIIYEKDGTEKNTLGSDFGICTDMKLSEFLEHLSLGLVSAYSMRDYRPAEYSTSIKMEKVKE